MTEETSSRPSVSASSDKEPRRRPIMIVEDDPVDREMIGLAFSRARVANPVVTMTNGQEAMTYLTAHAQYQFRRESDLPAVIVLDLDMPQMDGFEFLRLVKANAKLASIPVVVLTTSQYDRDLSKSYAMGASSCLTKPGDFEELVQIAAHVDRYWCRTNRIPES